MATTEEVKSRSREPSGTAANVARLKGLARLARPTLTVSRISTRLASADRSGYDVVDLFFARN